MANPEHGIALCAVGLEKVCSHELGRIGLRCVSRRPGRLAFETGDLPLAAALERANIRLRTAERVLLELGSFPARDFDELYEGVRGLPWEMCMRPDGKLAIERVRTHDSRLTAQTAVQSVAHKAAYERMMRIGRIGRMPETGATASARLYIENDLCTVGIDCSGDALHKRGWRKQAGTAPLKETVAAGLLFLAGWTRRLPLADPFCGAGSIAIEAALYAVDRAPGLARHFAIAGMPFAEPALLRREREEAAACVRSDVTVHIRASDSDPQAVEMARANAARAGVSGLVEFSVMKAEDAAPAASPSGASGILLANPPYGERMGTVEEAHELYGRLSGMRDRFSAEGWGMGFITNAPDFGDHFGRKPVSARRILNGAEEQWFHWYPGSSGARGA